MNNPAKSKPVENKPSEIISVKTLGWHWFLDLSQCGSIPTAPKELEAILCESARIAGATIVESCFHSFSPFGLSGVVVIAESHLAIHTWPEHHAVCIDLFSCTESLDVTKAFSFLESVFQAEGADVRCEKREVRCW